MRTRSRLLLVVTGIFLILIEIYLFGSIPLLYQNQIFIQLLTSYTLGLILANDDNPNFGFFKINTMILIILLAIEFSFSSPLIINNYLIIFLFYFWVRYNPKAMDEVNLTLVSTIIGMFMLLKVMYLGEYYLITGVLDVNSGVILNWLIDIGLNTVITLVFYKIFKKSSKLLYN